MRLPYLDFLLDFGWFGARTQLFVRKYENKMFNWVTLQFWVLKWTFQFRLYSPDSEFYSTALSRFWCRIKHSQVKKKPNWEWGKTYVECSCEKRWVLQD